MVIAVFPPEITVLVAVLMAKVTMKLTMFAARQPVGVRLGMLILEGIVIVVMLVAQLLVLRGMSPVALIPPVLIVGHCWNGNANG